MVCADTAFSRNVFHTSERASSNIPDLVSFTSLCVKECRRYSFSATSENIALARRVGAMAAAEAAEGPVEETKVRISLSIPWQYMTTKLLRISVRDGLARVEV